MAGPTVGAEGLPFGWLVVLLAGSTSTTSFDLADLLPDSRGDRTVIAFNPLASSLLSHGTPHREASRNNLSTNFKT